MCPEVEHDGVDHCFVESHLDHGHVGIGQEGRGVREIESEAIGECGEDKGAGRAAEFDDAHLHEIVAQDAIDAKALGGTALGPAHGGDVAEVDTAESKGIELSHACCDGAAVGILSGLCLTECDVGTVSKGVAHATGCTGVKEETASSTVDGDIDHEFAILLHIGHDSTKTLCSAGEGQQGDEQKEKAEDAHRR